MAVYPDADADFRTPRVRTEHESRCNVHAPVADASPAQLNSNATARSDAAGIFPRTEQPVSTARPPLAPTGWARVEVADRFDAALQGRWEAGDAWASNRALARPVGLDERVIRQWRDARKSLPLAALLVLPAPVVTELVAWVQDRRALTPHRRGVPMLAEALDRLERRVDRDDRAEVVRALAEAQRRVGNLLARLATEGA